MVNQWADESSHGRNKQAKQGFEREHVCFVKADKATESVYCWSLNKKWKPVKIAEIQ